MLDNHIQQGNALGIDPKQITWRRCVDMNDRQLRNIVDGLGGRMQGVPREDGFDITVASEVMAVLCLASDIPDLKARLGRIIVGYTYAGAPVTAHDLKAEGAMAALLKNALKPNLVQTLEHTPALIHGGPFANIAHGCNSVTATRMALKLGDYAITEAGFGADLGAEKFLDIKCRMAGLKPDAVVLVATVRALKHHGGAAKADLGREDLAALERGLPTCCSTWTTSRTCSACPAWWPSMPSPPTRRQSCSWWRTSAGSWASAWRSARCGPRAERAAGPWRRKWCACAGSPRTSATAMTWTAPSRTSWRPSAAGCIAPTAWR